MKSLYTKTIEKHITCGCHSCFDNNFFIILAKERQFLGILPFKGQIHKTAIK